MKTIAISKFKATCLGVIEEVSRTKRPVVVTRFGKPMAQINPVTPEPKKKGLLGRLEGTMVFHDDLVKPLDPEDWGSLY